MSKRMAFNIYAENLQDVVYDSGDPRRQPSPPNGERFSEMDLKPIPKPAPEFWKESSGFKKRALKTIPIK